MDIADVEVVYAYQLTRICLSAYTYILVALHVYACKLIRICLFSDALSSRIS